MVHEFGAASSPGDVLESGPARRILRAAVETLGERVPADVAGDMSANLPAQLAGSVPVHETDLEDLQDFLADFRRRAGLEGDGLEEAQVAFGILEEMLPPHTVATLRESVQPELEVLFERGVHGPDESLKR